MEIYDAKLDAEFKNPYVDRDEMMIRKLDDGRELPFRFIHGGFEGTDVKFSFSFPDKEAYEGRFYQYLSPFPGPNEEMASLPITGPDDKIGFCITHGAYYVETNMGSKQIFTNSSDHTLTHRSSAAAAEYSRIKAQEIYGYEHRPYGYVYGGSGGGYRTMACIENTNAFDGAAPYIIGSPYAIPNCQSTRALAERVLRNKMKDIVDAVDAGGSGDPYAGLNEDEAAVLKEVTLFGYPMKSWFASADGNSGALPVLLPGVKAMDPSYFTDFWEKEGYEGAVLNSNAQRDRIKMKMHVRACSVGLKEASAEEGGIDTRNGANNAWKKMIATETDSMEPWIEFNRTPVGEDLFLPGSRITFLTGDAKGCVFETNKIKGNRIYLVDGFGTAPIKETLAKLSEGDEAEIDNSDFIAMGYYHRHQVPSVDYKAWDQFRDNDGNPLYPQQKTLVGPVFTGNGPGCKQNGEIQGKIIVCASLMDEQAYPWQPDWYRRKVASVKGGDPEEYMRLYYFDNCLHDDQTASVDELHATSYLGGLKQALLDLAAWVEKGVKPLPSTNYSVDIGHVIVGETAKERGGLQPVVHLTANKEKCTRVKVNEEVTFEAAGEVPENAGGLTFVEWSFEGEQDFPEQGEWTLENNGEKGISVKTHTYTRPGTYFAVVRVKSERNGDPTQLYTQVRNIDRVRVIVEE